MLISIISTTSAVGVLTMHSH